MAASSGEKVAWPRRAVAVHTSWRSMWPAISSNDMPLAALAVIVAAVAASRDVIQGRYGRGVSHLFPVR